MSGALLGLPLDRPVNHIVVGPRPAVTGWRVSRNRRVENR